MLYDIKYLLNLIEENSRNYDVKKIEFAYHTADAAHGDQTRKSGERYVIHPVAVACILVGMGLDTDSICAALLHDVAEDTMIEIDNIKRYFGEEVALLVDGMTKLKELPESSEEELQNENIKKLLITMSKDIRVIIIKLADRLHNMRTLEYMKPEKQVKISTETLQIYAPIAHRLGMSMIKEELEDLALSYADPTAYKEIDEYLQKTLQGNNNFLENKIEKIKTHLLDNNLSPRIEGRIKSKYGIYLKTYKKNRSFDEIYDIFAIRIIVDNVKDCYIVLSIIHGNFNKLDERFKDYIRTAKQNMYQSLHTTLFTDEKLYLEVQIRTWSMHQIAEYGIAAHWKYKSGVMSNDKLTQHLTWIRQLIETQKENDETENIIQAIKSDVGSDEIYVYTPKGKVINLPVDSTAIDFAYKIHSEIGNKMMGAKINARIIPLDTKLKSGNIVEIMTTNNQNHKPNREWLKMAKTSEARNKIRNYFKKEQREENIAHGKAELENEFKRNSINYPKEEISRVIDDLTRRKHFKTNDDFFAAIGYGGLLLSNLMQMIRQEYHNYAQQQKQPKNIKPINRETIKSSTKNVVKVDGIEDCMAKISCCCNPLPGDEIIGYVTRGHGVSVHSIHCVNVINAEKDPLQKERFIGVQWVSDSLVTYRSTICITANDRKSLLVDVTTALSSFKITIHELSARQLKNNNANIYVTISVKDMEQLEQIINKLSKIKDVISVERAGK